jgi:hypothetical protein
MSSDLRSVTLRLPARLFAQIQIIADKRGATVSDTMRELLNRGLTERVYEENTSLLAQVVRAEMSRVLAEHYGPPQPYCLAQPIDPRRLVVCRRIG